MGDSVKCFTSEDWRGHSSLRFSFLDFWPATDHRPCALGLPCVFNDFLFLHENCYSALLDSMGDSRKGVFLSCTHHSVLQQLLVHRVEMPSARLYMILLVGSQTDLRQSQKP